MALITHSHLALQFFSAEITGRDRERFQQLKTIVDASHDRILQNKMQIQKLFVDFLKHRKLLNDKCHDFTVAAFKDTSDTNQYAPKANYLFSLTELVIETIYQSSMQGLELIDLADAHGSKADQALVTLIAKERVSDLKILGEKLESLNGQDKFEVEQMVIIRNQQLREETQKFDQFMQQVKFNDTKKQVAFEQKIQEREQKRLEYISSEELAIKKLRISTQHELEKLKEISRKELELQKIRSAEESDREAITVEERIKIAQIKAETPPPMPDIICRLM